ncbi:hypothetical protein PtrSN002B_002761 [Pyrenophora tritici-repentis]|uniref:Uncharacterized protein n=2 Tax=Pyrenophora tritici-repentis TaxID=45151 RepID=A0A2W1I1I4_9PLEO|nr:uncharacterized protein PTRG_03865 [Pyrenophora tritici-repentis Pt-1C-BFP]KAA8620076.1 hypothetical protein PtrV1_07170 [Pyrenophora tritici-repentis]EDU46703.1 predicted protein [Pyrenophora tritici-repentis Pt-1C-BFP]KAF7448227.1 hypothetical protein A1F99_075910 [Pyrenophora tritici-repentis]KAF7571940.1 hypothetical protein PtrM4_094400 [Pyrenophora tritici-repentis]KAG9384870.1 hypothetical protein A1F94_004417 [Pyrenophora tritici-repentis]
MSVRIPRSFSRSAPITSWSFLPRNQVPARAVFRTYADSAVPGQSSNVSNPQASNADSQDINKSASLDGTKNADTASVQNPVSNTDQDQGGQSETTTESEDNMKHDPNQPAEKNREKTVYGQNKPLDPADK